MDCTVVYATFKSRNSPVARGRMSVRLSMDDLPLQMPPDDEGTNNNPHRRGWWDHVPEPNSDSFLNHDPFENEKAGEDGTDSGTKPPVKRLPSHLAQHLGPKEQRQRTLDARHAAEHLEVPDERLRGRQSPTLSTNSRLSRMFPRVNLFRKVVKDEVGLLPKPLQPEGSDEHP